MLSVNKLRELNYKVQLVTRRYLRGTKKLFRLSSIRELGVSEAIDPRGGEVVAVIETPSGEILKDASICARNENFNRKVGIELALYRALSQETGSGHPQPELKLSEAAEKALVRSE